MAGRKRSHDDAAPDLDDEAPAAPVSSPDAPAAATKVVTSRPHLPTRKSQRMSTAASPTATSVDEPIDPAALALGLGWARRDPSSSDSSLSAQDTFIKNHFPNMRSPRITLYNRGLGYAVVLSAPHTPLERAHWWLFDLDLKRARFLCEADGGEEGELLARLGNKVCEGGRWEGRILSQAPMLFAKPTAIPAPTMTTTTTTTEGMMGGPVRGVDAMEVD